MGALALALSALAIYFGTGLRPIFWLTWLIPLPTLVLTRRLPALAAALVGFGAFLLGGLNVWGYLRDELHMPLAVGLLIVVLPALVFALAALLWRGLIARGRPLAAALALPAFLAGAEHLVALGSPHGAAWCLAYTQLDFLPVVQAASVLGPFGVSFLVLLPSSAVAASLAMGLSASSREPSAPGQEAASWRRAAGPLALGVTIVGAALGFGAWRLSDRAAGAAPFKVGLACASRPNVPLPLGEDRAHEVLQAYAKTLDGLAAEGVDLAVLPETVVAVSEDELDEAVGLLGGKGRGGLKAIVGLALRGERVAHNVALAIGAGASPSVRYAKQHLIPVFEGQYEPGAALTLLPGAGPPVGLAVCKDMDFPPLARAYGALGARLLLVPAWDFDRDAWLHGRMAILRGVEGGFSIARSARRGSLTLSDDRGRVLAEAPCAASPVASLAGELPPGSGETPYARFGDWFAWLCVAGVAASLVFVAVRRRAGAPMGA